MTVENHRNGAGTDATNQQAHFIPRLSSPSWITDRSECSIDQLSDLPLLRDFPGRPVDAGHVRAEVEAQAGGIAQVDGHVHGVFRIEQQRVLARRAGVRNHLQTAAGNVCFDLGFNGFQIHPCLPARSGPGAASRGSGSSPVPDRARQSAARGTRWVGRRLDDAAGDGQIGAVRHGFPASDATLPDLKG